VQAKLAVCNPRAGEVIPRGISGVMDVSGYLRQRAPGTWTIQWSLPKDKDGKYCKASKTFYGKKRDAQAELDRIVQEVRSGNYVAPTKMTVEDLLRRWLRDYAATSVAGTTYERYAGIVDQHLIPPWVIPCSTNCSRLRSKNITRMLRSPAGLSRSSRMAR
jgi:hypothetical protein